MKYKSDINFFEHILKDKSKKAADLKKHLKYSLEIFGVITAAAIIIMLALNRSMELKTDNATKQTNELISIEQLNEIEENKQTRDLLKSENGILKSKLGSVNSAQKITLADIENVAVCQPDNIEISSFSYSKGKITVSCKSSDELCGANFSNSLRKSGKFKEIKYTGASKSNKSDYAFAIEIMLDGMGG